ncbi:MAG: hypothetical protein MZV64_11435 [Ignavibacteriales bacterium]|nr:hypothetical protein [Ignavibacteriales bacterium]
MCMAIAPSGPSHFSSTGTTAIRSRTAAPSTSRPKTGILPVEMGAGGDTDVDLGIAASLVPRPPQPQGAEDVRPGVELRRQLGRVSAPGLDDVAPDDAIEILAVVEALPDELPELGDGPGRVGFTELEGHRPERGLHDADLTPGVRHPRAGRRGTRRQIVARPDHDRRQDEDGDPGHDQPARRFPGPLPLVEVDPPQAAEGDDEGHMDRPAREVVLAHLGRAHAVEEELEVPGRPGQRGPDVVGEERRHRLGRRRGRAPGRPRRIGRPDPAVVAPGPVLEAQRGAPDEVRREPAEEGDDQHREILENRPGPCFDGRFRDGLAGGERESHARAHDPGEHGHPSPLGEVELGDRRPLFCFRELLLLFHPGNAAHGDAGEADEDAEDDDLSGRRRDEPGDPALEDGRHERPEDRAESQREGHPQRQAQVAHAQAEGQAADAPQHAEEIRPEERLARSGPEDPEKIGAREQPYDPGHDDPAEGPADEPVDFPGPTADVLVGDIKAAGGEPAEGVEQHPEERIGIHRASMSPGIYPRPRAKSIKSQPKEFIIPYINPNS